MTKTKYFLKVKCECKRINFYYNECARCCNTKFIRGSDVTELIEDSKKSIQYAFNQYRSLLYKLDADLKKNLLHELNLMEKELLDINRDLIEVVEE